jgi:phytoene dehydrogenase-like protein
MGGSPVVSADAVVIGAGFGGLGAALALARRGARVVVCEKLRYPGGCASTFTRGGARYETGATLFSGFAEGQLVHSLLGSLGKQDSVKVDILDPVITLRAPGLTLDIPPDRDRAIAGLCALPGAPVERLRAFFATQRAVADALWPLFDDVERVRPGLGLAWHLGRLHRYPAVARWISRPLAAVVAHHGLSHWAPLRTWLDALCQITVQAGMDEAEAPFALSAMDYPFRGTGHVHGGIGVLANALCEGIVEAGGEVRLAAGVRGLARGSQGWTVQVRRDRIETPLVVANLLPQALDGLLGGPPLPALAAQAEAVRGGWGAAMLYLQLDPAAPLPDRAFHWELVQDPDQPFVHGNHLFCSVSDPTEDRGPGGLRTATVSTHVDLSALRGRSSAEQAAVLDEIHGRMEAGIQALAPELWAAHTHRMTASPRTWQRFTGRPEGLVGGVPRRAGLANYRGLWPAPVLPGLWMVGDSAFPGQSTLATLVGGMRVGRAAALG